MHVAVPDRTTMIDLMNMARYFLPHLLALSTSSPFWMGRDTGLKSFRTTVFRRFPRTGIPDHFSSWSEYEDYVNLLVQAALHRQRQENLVGRSPASHVWHAGISRVATWPPAWKKPSPSPRLTQAIVVKLHRLYTRNMGFRMYPRALIEENKWRAARWGVEGKLIDFGKQAEVPMQELGEELLEFVDDVVDDLGSRAALRANSPNFARGHERRAAVARIQGNRVT